MSDKKTWVTSSKTHIRGKNAIVFNAAVVQVRANPG